MLSFLVFLYSSFLFSPVFFGRKEEDKRKKKRKEGRTDYKPKPTKQRRTNDEKNGSPVEENLAS